ncbi:MAG: cupredoxin domain-containing protein [Candidatus Moranbacteria bacterium]|jgi:plastocyanin domain-containing protein|nr:cupredoxin domain-containing protein [Candidatus Moranbacteria bacterium]MBP9801383.1 cupredoxin domain-containing protein [Candidatus Moranbacteria bacterium]
MKIFFWILFGITLLVGGYLMRELFFSEKNQSRLSEEAGANNVTESDGKQYIEIRAKGGYLPRVSVAKAEMPTILRFRTESTFDCSSQVLIPSLNISQVLSSSGVTETNLGVLKPGTIQGLCSMGMYSFEIQVE